ncbi:DsbE family thiol:disulfide interchange protein [[Haemophilus] felis]|nr:DsbE family thiol:disulfide interchange protein [[Haemophilus] felis]NBI43393.1 DsbE family thiol:disulfide interchange protein [[Haemophilus] felis]
MHKKYFVPLFLFIAFVLVAIVQLQRNAQGEDPKALESALIGKVVPLQKMEDLFNNQPLSTQIFQQGKPFLLNVWATWCPTCYAEHQYLNELAAQGITIIGLNYKDSSEKAIKWLKDLGNPYQVVIKDEKGSLGLDLGVYGAPETFIVDAKGVIHHRHIGDVNANTWQQKLLPIYQKLQVQP